MSATLECDSVFWFSSKKTETYSSFMYSYNYRRLCLKIGSWPVGKFAAIMFAYQPVEQPDEIPLLLDNPTK